MRIHLVIAASAAIMLAPKAATANEKSYQFQSPRIGGSQSDQGAVQVGVNNDFNSSEYGSGNVISFLQGTRASDASSLQTTFSQIGTYGLAAKNQHGDDVDHAALSQADNLATRLNNWVAAGASSDGSSADIEQDGDNNITVFLQLGDSLITNVNQVGSDNEAWVVMATHDSRVDIDQENGGANLAVVTQLTDGVGTLVAEAVVVQDGHENNANITQAASLGTVSLSAAIEQSGNYNIASIYQAGQSDANDRADIAQEGDDNLAMMSIYGLGNSGQISQNANGTYADIQFTGNDNWVRITQYEDNAHAATTVSGDDNNITIKQIANSTRIDLNITGNNNKMKITQR